MSADSRGIPSASGVHRPASIDHPRVASAFAAPRWGLVALGFVLSIATAAAIAWSLQASGDWTRGLAWERALLASIPTSLSPALDLLFLTLPWLSSNTVVLPLVTLAGL